ncbi:MAG: aminomethyl-transferring glycine dehydrogenase subunit GcvPB [Candidatus Thermoplasmatota archaeon]|nr:aminomethyl-transferring glycine dehydrogenase subunit GcvPB [Candidatus Thermoplasmatota archaeon]
MKHTFQQARYDEPLLIEKGKPGRSGAALPPWDDMREVKDLLPEGMVREGLKLPELTEPEVIRHFVRLSQMNYGTDSGIYPLGSCTMKYNPKVNDRIASHPTLCRMHPLQPEDTVQGVLKMMYELQRDLSEIGGLDACTLQPAAGAAGEFTGLLIARKCHRSRGDMNRDEVIIPNSAHGTNPASAVMAGLKVIVITSAPDGTVDLDALKEALSERTAAFMITNPSTLGIFESNIIEIQKACHDAGALLYYDGANLNALMGKARPGDMGFDIMHFNLHKTFSTPHGGGGPGSGPVAVTRDLEKFLPVPYVVKEGNTYRLDNDRDLSIGKVKGFFGNVGVLVRAWAYIKMMGGDGLKRTSELAVLNASYIRSRIQEVYPVPFRSKEQRTKHEFVASASFLKEKGGSAKNVSKLLVDRGLHPPTNYFPLIVEEALMIEPTESETMEELEKFSQALIDIAGATEEEFNSAPHNSTVARVDEVLAAKKLILNWNQFPEEE